DKNDFPEESMVALLGLYREALVKIIDHCARQEETEYTPFDLGDNILSLEELDYIYSRYGKSIQFVYNLSPMQTGMLFHSVLDSQSHAYFEQTSYTIHGSLDTEVFEESFNFLIQRYDILRSNFIHENLRHPHQVVFQERYIPVSFKDISDLSPEEKNEYIKKTEVQEINRGFNLSTDNLIRIGIIRIDQELYKIIWSHHHILMDGWCLGIIIQELMEIYQSLRLHTTPLLPRIFPYRNYISWLKKLNPESSKVFWKNYLSGYEQKAVLPVINQNTRMEYRHRDMIFSLNENLTRKLEKLAARCRVTVNTVFSTIWGLILQRYNNTNDVVFGAIVSGRPPELEGIERMIGLFINTVPVRIQVETGESFLDLISKVQKNALEADRNSFLPLADIQGLSELKQDLIDHILAFENFPLAQAISDGNSDEPDLEIGDVDSFEQTSYDFNVIVFLSGQLSVRFSYNSSVYEDSFVNRIWAHLSETIQAVLDNPEIKLDQIDILTQEEREQILVNFNNTKANFPFDHTIHGLFEKQVEATPDLPALTFDDKSMNYRELNLKSNQLAYTLREAGVVPGAIIGLLAERSMEMVVGILGILKAGGAYLPVEPIYPSDRINYILEDSGAEILLTQTHLTSQINSDCRIILLDQEDSYSERNDNLPRVNAASDLAYIIYTSGTTGNPKGVMIEHKNVVRLMFNDKMQFDFSQEDVWTLFHSFCFDFSVWEMYGALLYGGRLVIVPRISSQDTREYLNLLKKEKVTILNQTPTAFYNLIREEIGVKEKELSLRMVIFGGEALKPAKLKVWREKYPTVKLINMYGITETTVHVTYKEISDTEIDRNISNIGTPIPTLTAYIMDGNMKLQPIGIAGELCVGGEGVGRGYLKRPELTTQKFIHNPYCPSERLYRSGDLARFLENGEIEYLGRIDHQVQIRGFRIELGEIENKLLENQFIQEVLVLAKEDQEGHQYLCAYIIAGKEMTINELRQYLSESLPEYMIPAYFIQMDRFPVNSNGKLDRKALPEPEGNINTGVEYEAPGNQIEEILVEVWQGVLGIEPIGIRDSFFALGGDSIKALQVSARLQTYGLKIELKDLFAYPTVAELSGLVVALKHCAFQGIIEGHVRLTPIQKWFFESRFPDEHHYNQSIMLYRKEGFVESTIKVVLDKIVSHHDALRIVFPKEKEIPTQVNRGYDESGGAYSFEVYDIRIEDLASRVSSLTDQIQSTIDLQRGPLMKAALFRTENGDHLLLALHHLIVDGYSWRILLEDLSSAYIQASRGEPIFLPQKSDSYQLWSDRLSEYAVSGELLKEIPFWKELEDIPVKSLVSKRQELVPEQADYEMRSLSLSEMDTEKLLKQVNHAFNTEINDILLTALGLAFRKWNGFDYLLIDLEGHGREELIKDVDISRTVGWFTSIYPVVLGISRANDLAYQIKLTKESLRKIPKKGTGYGVLKYLTPEEVRPGLLFKLKPEISFNYMGQFDQNIQEEVISISPLLEGHSSSTKNVRDYLFDINGMISDKKLEITFFYSIKNFDAEDVLKLMECYKNALLEIINFCSSRETSEMTSSDFTIKDFAMDEIDEMLETIVDSVND
ncbi:MAG: amino acid adenylation domain-containing protein, partial [Bacteroidales bacterium]|nr:amino acid adenylation domain-containing protein [Bacteroidales bacterium]